MQTTRSAKLNTLHSDMIAKSSKTRYRKKEPGAAKLQIGAKVSTEELVALSEVMNWIKDQTGIDVTMSTGIAWCITEARRSVNNKKRAAAAAASI